VTSFDFKDEAPVPGLPQGFQGPSLHPNSIARYGVGDDDGPKGFTRQEQALMGGAQQMAAPATVWACAQCKHSLVTFSRAGDPRSAKFWCRIVASEMRNPVAECTGFERKA